MPHRERITPLEGIAALYGVGDWSEAEYLATRRDEEEKMARHPHGRISRQRAEMMAKNLPPSQRPALELLTDDEPAGPVRAAVRDRYRSLWPPQPDSEPVDGEHAHLWPPGTPGIGTPGVRASGPRPLSDDELYDALFGGQP